MLRHFGTDLAGVSINRLLATEDHIELLTLPRLKNLYRAGEDVTGSQCIRAAEFPAGHQDRLIGTDSQAIPQGTLCLGRAHGEQRHRTAGLLFHPQRHLQGKAVKGVQNTGHAVPDQCIGDRIDLYSSRIRHLLDTDKNIHGSCFLLRFCLPASFR